MTYANRPVETSTTTERRYITNNTDFGDRIHWGPILAGLVVTISTQLLLSALGSAVGFTTIANSGAPRSDAGDVATGVGIWSIISLFISLFIGGWVTSRACHYINRSTAVLNGAILWATALALGAWLLASGVSGTFGVAASNAGSVANQVQQSGVPIPGTTTTPGTTGTTPNVTPPTAQQTRQISDAGAKAGWGFTIGSLLGLAAATLGASTGARTPRYDRGTSADG
jgi:hypothetical protein